MIKTKGVTKQLCMGERLLGKLSIKTSHPSRINQIRPSIFSLLLSQKHIQRIAPGVLFLSFKQDQCLVKRLWCWGYSLLWPLLCSFLQISSHHIMGCLFSRERDLLAGRGTRGRTVRIVTLICSLRCLNTRVLTLVMALAVVTLVGVECVASVLLLLRLTVGGRWRSSVEAILLAIVVTTLVHLVLVVVLVETVGHPSSTIDGLDTATLATAR